MADQVCRRSDCPNPPAFIDKVRQVKAGLRCFYPDDEIRVESAPFHGWVIETAEHFNCDVRTVLHMLAAHAEGVCEEGQRVLLASAAMDLLDLDERTAKA